VRVNERFFDEPFVLLNLGESQREWYLTNVASHFRHFAAELELSEWNNLDCD
jgi:hypothetical protein